MKLSELDPEMDEQRLSEVLPPIPVSVVNDEAACHDYYDGPMSGAVTHEGRLLYFHYWGGQTVRVYVLVEATRDQLDRVKRAISFEGILQVIGGCEAVGWCSW